MVFILKKNGIEICYVATANDKKFKIDKKNMKRPVKNSLTG